MVNIIIDKMDETYIRVRVDNDSVRKDLDSYFCYKQIGYQHTPRFKKSKSGWQGETHLYQIATGRLLAGLYWHVIKFAKAHNINVISSCPPEIENITTGELLKFLDKLDIHSNGKQIEVHDYQIEAIQHALKYNRALLLSPTSSGKSLIIYSLVRAYLKKKKRILISVPSTMLVNQLIGDFTDYSSNVSWDAEKACTSVFYGAEKDFGKEVVIGTWQSLVKLEPDYLASFDVIIADEAHSVKGDIVSTLIKGCVNASVRLGVTGTLDGKILSAIYLQGLFGATYKTISIKELIDTGRVATPVISCLALAYPYTVKKPIDITDYQSEMNWLVSSKERMKFITNLTSRCAGNTLVLFTLVDKHGKPLYEMMKSHLKNKTVLYISGETNIDDREDIKKLFKERNDIVLVASFSTFSTGISILSIMNLILASPVKSRIKLWQSIGRILRLCVGKTHANVFDISDDLRRSNKINHTWKHAKSRAEEYESEGIDYSISEVDMSKYYQ